MPCFRRSVCWNWIKVEKAMAKVKLEHKSGVSVGQAQDQWGGRGYGNSPLQTLMWVGPSGRRTFLLPRVVTGALEVCGLAKPRCQHPECLVQALGVCANAKVSAQAVSLRKQHCNLQKHLLTFCKIRIINLVVIMNENFHIISKVTAPTLKDWGYS